ncbi:MAG: amidohydrolase [Dehalococcoidia bacterium]|nr:amidohydrolase [Dehalococcoidia bacterium]MDW8119854.1 DUF6282 family protein [Chloroflexota bacterium]
MSTIRRLLQGAIDIHVHFAPDPRVERRSDALEVAQYAKAQGMRGLVLKSHEYPTAPVAYTVAQVVQGIELYGGLSLDEEVGGLNPVAVEASARMGAKVVWFPTFSAKAWREPVGEKGGIRILDDRGRLVPPVHHILEITRHYDMVLATGHIGVDETFALVEEARRVGIGRIVITHASSMTPRTGLTVEHQKRLAQMGAYIEHCVHAMMPTTLRIPPSEIAQQIRAVGEEHCILSTDFGQAFHPIAPEGLRMGIAWLLGAGLSVEAVEQLVKYNPARLLGLGG